MTLKTKLKQYLTQNPLLFLSFSTRPFLLHLTPSTFTFFFTPVLPCFWGWACAQGRALGSSPTAAAPAAGGRPPGAPRNLLLPATKTPKKLPHFPCLQPPAMAGTELKLGRRWPATHGPPRPNTPSRGAPPICGEATPANYLALEAPEQGAPRRPPAAAPAHGGARAFRPPSTTIRPARDFYTFYDL